MSQSVRSETPKLGRATSKGSNTVRMSLKLQTRKELVFFGTFKFIVYNSAPIGR